jgi:folate-dependent phosphoribosylglycinamide formyltransferase PurN
MRTVLICHADDALNRDGLARWLASFSDLAGVVVIHEPRQRLWRRVRREWRRVGFWRLLDVFAFRLYYRLALRDRDRAWEEARLAELRAAYPELTPATEILHTPSPNSPEAVAFVRRLAPDLTLARCKTLLKPAVFEAARSGTFVMHPGICPEYRNAHGCFWALARGDLGRVGMTLLRIDRGVDTGPVFGHYRCDLDEEDSHIVIQHRVVFDNLARLRAKLQEIADGRARPVDTAGRASAEWGQPWLTAWWAWRRQARRRAAWRSHCSTTTLSIPGATTPAASPAPAPPATS